LKDVKKDAFLGNVDPRWGVKNGEVSRNREMGGGIGRAKRVSSSVSPATCRRRFFKLKADSNTLSAHGLLCGYAFKDSDGDKLSVLVPHPKSYRSLRKLRFDDRGAVRPQGLSGSVGR